MKDWTEYDKLMFERRKVISENRARRLRKDKQPPLPVPPMPEKPKNPPATKAKVGSNALDRMMEEEIEGQIEWITKVNSCPAQQAEAFEEGAKWAAGKLLAILRERKIIGE